MPTTDEIETLRGLVASLSAPHEDHCGSQCYGGRTDCCSRCAVLEGLVEGVREMNATAADQTNPITLPSWCASVHGVDYYEPSGSAVTPTLTSWNDMFKEIYSERSLTFSKAKP